MRVLVVHNYEQFRNTLVDVLNKELQHTAMSVDDLETLMVIHPENRFDVVLIKHDILSIGGFLAVIRKIFPKTKIVSISPWISWENNRIRGGGLAPDAVISQFIDFDDLNRFLSEVVNLS